MESKEDALKRAKREGFSEDLVVQASGGGWYIAPHGITRAKAKRAYADCREKGGSKGLCAAVSWGVEKKEKAK